MTNQVAEILAKLIGLPLWSIGRAASLEWFAFGTERIKIPRRDGTYKIVSEYALHVECARRIRHNHKMLVAYGDRFYPAGKDPYKNLLDFDWNTEANQLDQRATKFIEENRISPLVVIDVIADETGSFCLKLNEEYFLEVFPHNSIVSEHWRLFKPYGEQEHFIFTQNGMKVNKAI